jgi:hypothetical protein
MPQSFKQRFVAALPPTPPALGLQLDEFIVFERASLVELDDRLIRFLTEHGLPRRASPFLSFSSYPRAEIENFRETGAIPEGFVPLGQNGSGDLLGIETSTKAVVYFNHDSHNKRVFINSTLDLFMESLCLYQEHLRAKTMQLCLVAIEKIDPAAVKPGSMWHVEALAN